MRFAPLSMANAMGKQDPSAIPGLRSPAGSPAFLAPQGLQQPGALLEGVVRLNQHVVLQ